MNAIKIYKAGYHRWFGLGLLLAFCVHQVQLRVTQRSLFDGVDHEVGSSAVSISGGSLRSSGNEDISCTWIHDDTSECDDLLRKRLPLGSENELMTSDDFIRRRWLFLGDSTMRRLFEFSPLHQHLISEPINSLIKRKPHACWQEDEKMGLICSRRMADRCKLNAMFDLPYAPQWKHPDPMKFEGPLKYGKSNPYCTDCSGCQSTFLDCQIRDMKLYFDHPELHRCDRKRITYGGYITVEFARDVEMQTPKYQTTQENVAAYLRKSWNAPDSLLVQKWGLPICVINTSAHDSMLDGILVEDFIANVNWYLNLFVSECSHIIWLSNTAPAKDGSSYVQTEQSMKDYNDAVEKLLANSRVLSKMSSFVNIFDESMNWPHADHIHMDNMFYHRLGDWMVEKLMK